MIVVYPPPRRSLSPMILSVCVASWGTNLISFRLIGFLSEFYIISFLFNYTSYICKLCHHLNSSCAFTTQP